MPVRVTGIVETQLMLAEVATTARRRVVRKLHEKALEIAELARKFAPVDEANLEKAIKVFPEKMPETRERNAAGQFAYVFAIGANAIVAAPLISSYCIMSLVWSRIFLKEKLSKAQYAVIAVAAVGIAILGME